ncbi:hypothetical protein GGQ74_000990 [Desulfobaculum xiamenense]|uniref:Uncharacterized protein n=1 Tax=Desulfobaculum xiamenense TaxID=995050 RepID=A0A846QJW1_9BACT|nr:hypothetical protein [Desulfobaculum xiamenense]NJB67350.1 hypothetical protein [Desulfobaculum xiamenense]
MSTENETILDITEMPLEGIAAYWLSLKKIMGGKVAPKLALDEAGRTEEPYIRYLLESCFTGLSDDQFLRVAGFKAETVVRGMQLRQGLIREAVLSMSAGENPRKALVRMAAHFPAQLMPEEKISRMALEMVKKARAGSGTEYTVTIDYTTAADQLLVKLMFYVFWARHEGAGSMRTFAETSRCLLFREALSMVEDGFDRSFIKACVDTRCEGLVREARLKMNMAAELALALRGKLSYDEMFVVAQAYMP